jgi:hypothetical protein
LVDVGDRAGTGGPVVGLMLPTAAGTDNGRVEPARVVEAAPLAETAGFDELVGRRRQPASRRLVLRGLLTHVGWWVW